MGVGLEPRYSARPDDLPYDLLDDANGVGTGEKFDQCLFGGGLRLSQKVQVAELARVRGKWVFVGHPPEYGGGVGTAAGMSVDDGADLLVTESGVGAVPAAVVDVVDHVRGLGTGRDVHEQAAPAWSVGVGNLVAAHNERRMNLAAGDLVDAVGELGQLDAAYVAGAAVGILHADEEQAAVHGERREVLGEVRVVLGLARR
jgi:hypothetical protein